MFNEGYEGRMKDTFLMKDIWLIKDKFVIKDYCIRKSISVIKDIRVMKNIYVGKNIFLIKDIRIIKGSVRIQVGHVAKETSNKKEDPQSLKKGGRISSSSNGNKYDNLHSA